MVLRTFALVALVGLFVVPRTADAQVGLRIQRVNDGAVRVDGMLRDWRGVPRINVGSGDDASMRFALGYDDRGLYLAAAVKDQRYVRTDDFGPQEDAIVIALAFPRGRGFETNEIFVFAGEEGRRAGAVSMGAPNARRLRRIPDAQVVERRVAGGYEVEAFVPWSRIPGAAPSAREEGRVAVRLRDVDSESRPEIVAEPETAPFDPRHPERLPSFVPGGGEHDVLAGFLQQQGIPGRRPRFDLRGDVQGDGRPERVVVVDRFVLVLGAGYRDGSGYDFVALPVGGEGDVLSAELRDMTGDRLEELVLRIRQGNAQGNRELLSVHSFPGTSIAPLFAIELRKATDDGGFESRFRIQRGRGAPRIEVTAGRAEGVTPERWRESPSTDAEPVLLPWGAVASRVYQWDGTRLATVSERANPRPWTPPAPEARSTTSSPRETAAPPPGAAELIAAVRRERRIPRNVRERFAQDANVAEDPRTERLVVLGRTLVVVGPGYRGGNGYFAYELAVERDDDLLEVTTGDVTGDGRAELLVRAAQRLGDVTREILLVHQFARDGSFPRLFAAEIARTHEGRRLENVFRATGRGLEITPGTARGFDASSWPWARGDGSDGIAPILLPWSDRPTRYVAQGGRLVAR
ncbi:MAG: hypothetical protein H6722_02730 [Sandaracinus sp.]|nr:hypothetical protein [Sandaracinus sp.]MCB9611348.1 hypothetical protein [Sandaracinus sp.]MCB9621814.1 hypothetical protein [Sandaracinus sp.]